MLKRRKNGEGESKVGQNDREEHFSAESTDHWQTAICLLSFLGKKSE